MSSDSTRRPSVLMVNYHTDTNRAAGRILESRGFEVFAVESLAAATEALGAVQFDVLLCRQTAGDGDPAQFMQAVRQRYPHLPAIAFGGGLTDDRIRELHE